uniref:Peptidase M1 membrane alanine aminopeptidase domain-containing protein n=1 Tax=Ascaris lumbricoides TaxID=6252 RepID=A0A0M3IN87_ASCLU
MISLAFSTSHIAEETVDLSPMFLSLNRIFDESERREDAFVASNFTVSDFIDSWIYQPGFPLLEDEEINDRLFG